MNDTRSRDDRVIVTLLNVINKQVGLWLFFAAYLQDLKQNSTNDKYLVFNFLLYKINNMFMNFMNNIEKK